MKSIGHDLWCNTSLRWMLTSITFSLLDRKQKSCSQFKSIHRHISVFRMMFIQRVT